MQGGLFFLSKAFIMSWLCLKFFDFAIECQITRSKWENAQTIISEAKSKLGFWALTFTLLDKWSLILKFF
jgi:hypothetical protein